VLDAMNAGYLVARVHVPLPGVGHDETLCRFEGWNHAECAEREGVAEKQGGFHEAIVGSSW
jgi:hypothetical protein